jgi:hypothetical protein
MDIQMGEVNIYLLDQERARERDREKGGSGDDMLLYEIQRFAHLLLLSSS